MAAVELWRPLAAAPGKVVSRKCPQRRSFSLDLALALALSLNENAKKNEKFYTIKRSLDKERLKQMLLKLSDIVVTPKSKTSHGTDKNEVQ